MSRYMAAFGFIIVKTITGNYFVGLNNKDYDNVIIGENRIWINNTMFPLSAIEYYKTKIPLMEFMRICRNAGIDNSNDVKETLMDFYSSKEVNPKYIKYLRYMEGLRY